MASTFVVVTPLENGVTEGIVIGHIDTALISQDARFDLPVGEAGTKGKRDVVVHGLEGLEDKGVTCRGRLDTMGEGDVDNIDKERWGKESNSIVVIVGMGKEIGTAREGIRAGEEFSRDMDHFQVKVSEINEPASLSMIEVLGGTEVGEILVVCKDLYGKWGPMEVVSPGFQGTDDGEEFSVIDVVVSFRRRERLGEIGAGMPVTVGISLEEDGSGGIFGGVSCNGERGGEVGEVKDWFQQEEGLKGIKRVLTSGGPISREVFLGEVDEGLGDVGVVRDERSLKVGKAKKGCNIFDFFRGWPTGNAIQLDRVHGELPGFDNHSEVFHFGGSEAALF